MNSRPTILHYQTDDGKIPFSQWMTSLRDAQAKARIRQRISRMEQGNFGDHRVLSEGVCELRIDYGPGYRLYYACYETCIVLLLCGGDKRSQQEDIARAKKYKKHFDGGLS